MLDRTTLLTKVPLEENHLVCVINMAGDKLMKKAGEPVDVLGRSCDTDGCHLMGKVSLKVLKQNLMEF